MEFLLTFLWAISLPFAYPFLLIKILLCKIKTKKYLKYPEDFLEEEKYYVVYKLIKILFFIKRIKPKFEGKEKIINKPQLFISNHRSFTDVAIIFKWVYENTTIRPIFIAKKELLDNKLSFIFKLIDTIFIDRNDIRSAVKIIDEQKELLSKKNKSIVVFPEGTRNTSEEMLEFHSAVFEPAYKSMCSIQPLVMSFTEFFYENKKEKNKNVKPVVFVMEPIQSNKFITINRTIFSQNMRKNMQKEYDNLIKDKK